MIRQSQAYPRKSVCLRFRAIAAFPRCTATLIESSTVVKGRKPSIDAVEVLRLRREEQLGPAAIARRLGIGRASVYRVLGKQATTVRGNGDFDADQA